MEIQTPELFNYEECLRYLNRSKFEDLHRVENGSVFKLFEMEGKQVLIRLSSGENKNLLIEFLNTSPTPAMQKFIKRFISEWFDLATPLESFYEEVKNDIILNGLTKKYFGLRLIKIPDLFEAISWSIIGQQINLQFAYQTKRNLVERCGEYLDYNDDRFYLFPKPQKVLELKDEDFKSMKFSKQKTNYLKGVAEKFISGNLNKASLQQLSPEEMKNELTQIKGIGNWSANYIMMRCFGFKEGFPVEDVGLHNAIKNQLQLAKKPNLEEVKELTSHWHNWKGYRTYYLWRSLLDG
ncbi:DNA-3-methyladenine glycosylase [Fulvivirgaceae bacterium BMA10]|uniref:DNA-3-methyladenine glycosylase II n=1 Tax=Splendidivirga corallicola TaxID=3051826 RepID=A0ABT8KWW6_9BACT|nr:DNA-3-methyladenine glycosylase [Fulvivirgaceae bacterium BMA10]